MAGMCQEQTQLRENFAGAVLGSVRFYTESTGQAPRSRRAGIALKPVLRHLI